MAEKELKRLNRRELMDIIYELAKENDALKAENEELRNTAEDMRILIDAAGSIAGADGALTEIFEKAQRAADIYSENMRAMSRAAVPEQAQENTVPERKRLRGLFKE